MTGPSTTRTSRPGPDHGHSQAGPDEAAHRGQVVPLRHGRPPARNRPHCTGRRPATHPRGPAAHDEGSAATAASSTASASGERVIERHAQQQRLDGNPSPLDIGMGNARGGRPTSTSRVSRRREGPRAADRRPLQGEGTWGRIRPKSRISPGTNHVPRLKREAERDQPAAGDQQLFDRGQAVVEIVDKGVHMAFEGRPGLSQAQHPAGAAQQRRADSSSSRASARETPG